MPPRRLSQTAAAVAFARGLAGLREGAPVRDPLAETLLPLSMSWPLRLGRRVPWFGRALVATMDLTFPHGLHLPLRTRAIDDALAEAVGQGARQVVLLGAGLDARAFRLSMLADTTVFEVDHPATQEYKRRRVWRLRSTCRSLRWVPVDFEKDSLRTALLGSGFVPERPSLFIWEGVTMYLTSEALHATLSQLRQLAAPGSRLLMTYCRPVPFSDLQHRFTVWASAAGEHFISFFSPEQAAALVGQHGLSVEQDEGDQEWMERYASPRFPATDERLMRARFDPQA